jgi:hypothetical protein
VLLRGLTLAFEFLLISGITFQIVSTKSAQSRDNAEEFARPIATTTRRAAIGLAIRSVHLCQREFTTGLKLSELVGATFAIAGLLMVLSCLSMYAYLARPARF